MPMAHVSRSVHAACRSDTSPFACFCQSRYRERETGALEQLDPLCFDHLLSFLEFRDCSVLCLVSSTIRAELLCNFNRVSRCVTGLFIDCFCVNPDVDQRLLSVQRQLHDSPRISCRPEYDRQGCYRAKLGEGGLLDLHEAIHPRFSPATIRQPFLLSGHSRPVHQQHGVQKTVPALVLPNDRHCQPDSPNRGSPPGRLEIGPPRVQESCTQERNAALTLSDAGRGFLSAGRRSSSSVSPSQLRSRNSHVLHCESRFSSTQQPPALRPPHEELLCDNTSRPLPPLFGSKKPGELAVFNSRRKICFPTDSNAAARTANVKLWKMAVLASGGALRELRVGVSAFAAVPLFSWLSLLRRNSHTLQEVTICSSLRWLSPRQQRQAQENFMTFLRSQTRVSAGNARGQYRHTKDLECSAETPRTRGLSSYLPGSVSLFDLSTPSPCPGNEKSPDEPLGGAVCTGDGRWHPPRFFSFPRAWKSTAPFGGETGKQETADGGPAFAGPPDSLSGVICFRSLKRLSVVSGPCSGLLETLSTCTYSQCHDLQIVLADMPTTSTWVDTVKRLISNAGRGGKLHRFKLSVAPRGFFQERSVTEWISHPILATDLLEGVHQGQEKSEDLVQLDLPWTDTVQEISIDTDDPWILSKVSHLILTIARHLEEPHLPPTAVSNHPSSPGSYSAQPPLSLEGGADPCTTTSSSSFGSGFGLLNEENSQAPEVEVEDNRRLPVREREKQHSTERSFSRQGVKTRGRRVPQDRRRNSRGGSGEGAGGYTPVPHVGPTSLSSIDEECFMQQPVFRVAAFSSSSDSLGQEKNDQSNSINLVGESVADVCLRSVAPCSIPGSRSFSGGVSSNKRCQYTSSRTTHDGRESTTDDKGMGFVLPGPSLEVCRTKMTADTSAPCREEDGGSERSVTHEQLPPGGSTGNAENGRDSFSFTCSTNPPGSVPSFLRLPSLARISVRCSSFPASGAGCITWEVVKALLGTAGASCSLRFHGDLLFSTCPYEGGAFPPCSSYGQIISQQPSGAFLIRSAVLDRSVESVQQAMAQRLPAEGVSHTCWRSHFLRSFPGDCSELDVHKLRRLGCWKCARKPLPQVCLKGAALTVRNATSCSFPSVQGSYPRRDRRDCRSTRAVSCDGGAGPNSRRGGVLSETRAGLCNIGNFERKDAAEGRTCGGPVDLPSDDSVFLPDTVLEFRKLFTRCSFPFSSPVAMSRQGTVNSENTSSVAAATVSPHGSQHLNSSRPFQVRQRASDISGSLQGAGRVRKKRSPRDFSPSSCMVFLPALKVLLPGVPDAERTGSSPGYNLLQGPTNANCQERLVPNRGEERTVRSNGNVVFETGEGTARVGAPLDFLRRRGISGEESCFLRWHLWALDYLTGLLERTPGCLVCLPLVEVSGDSSIHGCSVARSIAGTNSDGGDSSVEHHEESLRECGGQFAPVQSALRRAGIHVHAKADRESVGPAVETRVVPGRYVGTSEAIYYARASSGLGPGVRSRRESEIACNADSLAPGSSNRKGDYGIHGTAGVCGLCSSNSAGDVFQGTAVARQCIFTLHRTFYHRYRVFRLTAANSPGSGDTSFASQYTSSGESEEEENACQSRKKTIGKPPAALFSKASSLDSFTEHLTEKPSASTFLRRFGDVKSRDKNSVEGPSMLEPPGLARDDECDDLALLVSMCIDRFLREKLQGIAVHCAFPTEIGPSSSSSKEGIQSFSTVGSVQVSGLCRPSFVLLLHILPEKFRPPLSVLRLYVDATAREDTMKPCWNSLELDLLPQTNHDPGYPVKSSTTRGEGHEGGGQASDERAFATPSGASARRTLRIAGVDYNGEEDKCKKEELIQYSTPYGRTVGVGAARIQGKNLRDDSAETVGVTTEPCTSVVKEDDAAVKASKDSTSSLWGKTAVNSEEPENCNRTCEMHIASEELCCNCDAAHVLSVELCDLLRELQNAYRTSTDTSPIQLTSFLSSFLEIYKQLNRVEIRVLRSEVGPQCFSEAAENNCFSCIFLSSSGVRAVHVLLTRLGFQRVGVWHGEYPFETVILYCKSEGMLSACPT
ncbi:f-box protein [Cystoisospora suis]|uniref:F-box protein n=1 Tax=Cystoisospora suis TaxID=483139 RepID=A0A2C6L935_9APIC|nr:f-box protein [Cystoisospora suis]